MSPHFSSFKWSLNDSWNETLLCWFNFEATFSIVHLWEVYDELQTPFFSSSKNERLLAENGEFFLGGHWWMSRQPHTTLQRQICGVLHLVVPRTKNTAFKVTSFFWNWSFLGITIDFSASVHRIQIEWKQREMLTALCQDWTMNHTFVSEPVLWCPIFSEQS